MSTDTTTIVRYMVSDVGESVDFYTKHFGFEPIGPSSPAFAAVTRGKGSGGKGSRGEDVTAAAPPFVAVMSTLPSPLAVTRPSWLTLATAGLLIRYAVQDVWGVTSCVLPSPSVATA